MAWTYLPTCVRACRPAHHNPGGYFAKVHAPVDWQESTGQVSCPTRRAWLYCEPGRAKPLGVERGTAAMQAASEILISADSHVSEAGDLWTSRLPAKFR